MADDGVVDSGDSRIGTHAVATGRLGRIYPSFDGHSGAVGVVEVVDAGSDPARMCETLLVELLRSQTDLVHANVFMYDTVRVANRGSIHVAATRGFAKHLYGLTAEFGRLHPLLVRSYVRATLAGLAALHEHGFACGGLSLSSLLLAHDGRVQLAHWFPSTPCLRALQQENMVVNNPFAASVLSRTLKLSLRAEQERDVRSVAYLTVEMLTGVRMRGRVIDDEQLLKHVVAYSLEHAFLLELLQPNATLKALVTHPYVGTTVIVGPDAGIRSRVDDQRELVKTLMEKELLQCREQKRQFAQEVRGWFAHFEKRYQRKPRADDRPTAIQRRQLQCRTANERILELERQLRVLPEERGEPSCEPSMATPTLDTRAGEQETGSHSRGNSRSVSPDLRIKASEGSVSPLANDSRRRSPAQNAFLRRLSDASPAHAHPHPQADVTTTACAASRQSQRRDLAHQLIHQRKEVMGVISGLEM